MAVFTGLLLGLNLRFRSEQCVEVFLHLAIDTRLGGGCPEKFVALVEIIWSVVAHRGKGSMGAVELVGRRTSDVGRRKGASPEFSGRFVG